LEKREKQKGTGKEEEEKTGQHKREEVIYLREGRNKRY
jgi:hypothetical protein